MGERLWNFIALGCFMIICSDVGSMCMEERSFFVSKAG